MEIPRTDEEKEIARSAARDAANKSMRVGGRTNWNREDCSAARDAANKSMRVGIVIFSFLIIFIILLILCGCSNPIQPQKKYEIIIIDEKYGLTPYCDVEIYFSETEYIQLVGTPENHPIIYKFSMPHNSIFLIKYWLYNKAENEIWDTIRVISDTVLIYNQ